MSTKEIKEIGSILNNIKLPLKQRFRALFTLKTIGGDLSIKEIGDCFGDESVLLKHELAYCLGQMQESNAVPILANILSNKSQEPIVRHEAAEALGAIATQEVIPILTLYCKDDCIEVKESCEVALNRIKYINSIKNSSSAEKNQYNSVDPSPAADENDLEVLSKLFLNESEEIYNRYTALFKLRNINSGKSILTVASGLNDNSSALFRHEVAFVLGQLRDPCSIPFLTKVLEDQTEHEMVRHECAEALGAIATSDCIHILKKYLFDKNRVVRESCEVALDMCDYELGNTFQYADALVKIRTEK